MASCGIAFQKYGELKGQSASYYLQYNSYRMWKVLVVASCNAIAGLSLLLELGYCSLEHEPVAQGLELET